MSRTINIGYIEDVCRYGAGRNACSFLFYGPQSNGTHTYQCAKDPGHEGVLASIRAGRSGLLAQGDNCPGYHWQFGANTNTNTNTEGNTNMPTDEIPLTQRSPADLAGAIGIIARELDMEARRRDWCDEYLEFIDRVNALVGYPVLTLARKRITVTVTYEAPLDYSTEGLLPEVRGAVEEHAGDHEEFLEFMESRCHVGIDQV